MRFIERVLRKSFPVGPDLVQNIYRVPLGRGAFNELRLHFIEYRFLLFTHGLSQYIGIPFTESTNYLGKDHHLLLVYGNSIGVFQYFFQLWQVIGNIFPAVFTVDVIRNIRDWAGTVQGVHRDEVIELIGLKVAQVFLHTRTFKLKRTNGICTLVERECFFIIQRQGINIYFDAVILFNKG